MSTQPQAPNLAAIKERQQKAWSSGDYSKPGVTLVLIAELLCEAVDLHPGRRVLDVATGNGNTALAAARRFCEVIGIDYVPALRLIPTIVGMGFTIGQAQRSRGLDLESGNIIRRIRKYLPLLVPVFVSTIRSTNDFSMALESKGFGASPGRTFFLRTAIGRPDVLVMVVFVAFLAGSIALRAAGYGELEGFTR
jgi:SAM-dependent methyltransferase